MTETLQSYFQAAGYRVDIENDPLNAIERLRTQEYDILLLDFLMRPICGDEVVRQIREFDRDLFIILLTGHKSMAPPIKTIRELDIQGYYEKSDRFDQLELLIESCTKSIRQMRTIRSYRDGLRKILEYAAELNCQQNVEDILTLILTQVTEFSSNCNGFVYFDFSAINDQSLKGIKHNPYHFFEGSGYYKYSEETAKEIFQQYDADDQRSLIQAEDNMLVAPLFTDHHQRCGILSIRVSEKVKNEDIQLFEVYSKQVGVIVSNLMLRSLLQTQNQELNKTYASLRKNYIETIDTIRQMVDAKDDYTRGHSDRVSEYAVKIAEAMGKDETYIERLRVAGLFHDMGKIGVSDGVLRKNGKLTKEEFDQIKKHPSLGRKILSSYSSFKDILPMIEYHHERYDGTGYPSGISGDHIPEEARIISVADAFDAMTTKRTYRDSLTLEKAIDELIRGKNTQFDAHIVDTFLKIVYSIELPNQKEDAVVSPVLYKKAR